ncbi:MAG: CdaR family protein, partial [Candidatus Caldatribacteriota bacterium]|nr:CdaR family protein [Candidatus Caldatribacteriota bacterium]
MKDLKKWLLRNIDIKLLSLFLAIIIWVYVASGENPIIDTFIDVPVTINNLKEDLVIKELPENISVGIKGPKDLLSSLSANQITGVIDLSDIKESGIYTLEIVASAPKKAEIIRVIPSEIKVEAEKVLTKEIEIEYSLIGIPEDGYSLTDKPKLDPSLAKVTGAQSKLETIKQLICTIDISGIKKDFNKKIKIKALNADGNEIKELKIEPELIEVLVSVSRGYPEKVLLIKPRIIGEPAPGYYISQILANPNKIKIYGNYSKINSLEFLETIPIDVNGISKTLSVKVSPELEEGLYIFEGEPLLTEISIQVRESIVKRTIVDVPIEIKNVSPFIFCEIEPKKANITIEGRNVLVEKVEIEGIKLYVEFTESLKNEQKVKIEVQLP